GGARLAHGGEGRAQVVVAVADVETEVVHPDQAAVRDGRGIRADLDEEELVMRASRGEGGGTDRIRSRLGQDLAPPEHVAVEIRRPAQVTHVQHEVAQFTHRHAPTLSAASGPADAERIQLAVGGIAGPRWIGTSKGCGSRPAASMSSVSA